MTPPLPVRRMSAEDLNGVLFCEFPAEWDLPRSRAALDRLVRRVGLVEISPANIHTALAAEGMRMFSQLPDEVRARKTAQAWEARRERRKKLGLKNAPREIKAAEWSF